MQGATMNRFILIFAVIVGGVSVLVLPAQAQTPDTTKTVVGILLVQFADEATVPDSRGSLGFSAPTGADTIENKYRYEDYWNIIFKPNGPVLHPDGDFPDEYAIGGRGFNQYGSLRRYLEDNSFGMQTIVPYRVWSASSGLLNTVTQDSSGNPERALINWLTLDSTKLRGWDPESRPTFTDPTILGDSAIAMATRSLDVAWDSLDVLIILYAGTNHFHYSRAGTFNGLSFAISSERAANDLTGAPTFSYPSVIWHEFLHAAIGAEDLHNRNSDCADTSQLCSAVGHFSIMGDNSHLASYTPPMLDPWHRLRQGWLRYYVPDATYDTLNLHVPLDTAAFHLPIVEERFNGDVPYVLVLPVKSHPDINGWAGLGQHLIIVENRRAIGWDSVIVKEENVNQLDPAYGQTSGLVGGFLIWGITDPRQCAPAWIYDADDEFTTWENTGVYGSPGDLYVGAEGHDTFSISSSPGVFTYPNPGLGMKFVAQSRNLYLEFPPYVDSSNVNPIARLVVDRFVPADFGFGADAENDTASTKFVAQQKITRWDSLTLATFGTGDRMFVMSGKSPENLRDVACVQFALEDEGIDLGNGAVATFNYAPLPEVLVATLVMQRREGNDYFVRLRHMNTKLTGSFTNGNNEWGPFQQPPHPVIVSRNEFGALAFAADSGIFISTTTNSGCDWIQPVLVNRSGPDSHSPFICLDTSSMGGDHFLVLFVDQQDTLKMFRSESGTITVLSDAFLQDETENPTASRLGTDLAVVYQYHDTWLNRHFIARKRVNLATDTVAKDWDAFGWKDQEPEDENRDPSVMHTDSADASKSLVCWIFKKGEKMLFASRGTSGQVNVGYQSVLSTKPTAYPHLFHNETDNPLFLVSRLGTWHTRSLTPPDEEPSLIMMSKEDDVASNPALLPITELGMDFSTSSSRLMHTHQSMPTVIHGQDTVGYLQYDCSASEGFSTEPVDTLTRTVTGTLADGDAVFFTLDVTCFTGASDTLLIESFLYDPGGLAQVSTSGEMRIPPFSGDTVLTVALEVPNGFPPTDCLVTTSMQRGYFGGGDLPEIDLVRYTLFDTPVIPKRRVRERPVVASDHGIRLWPQPARSAMHIAVDGTRDATATLVDLLGRRVRQVRLSGNGNTALAEMTLSGITPGVYMLVVRTDAAVRTGKVVIAR
jgi:hypothetical protein